MKSSRNRKEGREKRVRKFVGMHILTINLVVRRKAKNETPITIVCQFHCESKDRLKQMFVSLILIMFPNHV